MNARGENLNPAPGGFHYRRYWAPTRYEARARAQADAARAAASDIPALLLAGTLDPITPPAWAEWAAATLSAGQVLVVPGVGHGVVGAYSASWCIDGVVERFLSRPERLVSAGCVGDLEPPDFVLP